MSIKVFANKNPWRRDIEVLIVDEMKNGSRAAGRLLMSSVEEGQIIDPTFTIDGSAAQELMDELWRCGIRPAEGVGSVGQLAATEHHLKDMQRLVFEVFTKKK